MTNRWLHALYDGAEVIDLGRQLRIGMPQSPNHPAFNHVLPRRHGDMVRADGGSAANDLITTGTHVGTHIDALAHVSQDGKLFQNFDAYEASVGGRFNEHGAHTISPIIRRGVLLDIPAALGVERCIGGYEISIADLRLAQRIHDVEINSGDVVLIRSGWGQLFDEGEAYIGKQTGVPGIGEVAAYWLAEQGVHAVGADTIAFERLVPNGGHGLLPAHRVFLVEHGIYIIEALDLEDLSKQSQHEFLFVAAPLNIYGATGSPVRPLAVFSSE